MTMSQKYIIQKRKEDLRVMIANIEKQVEERDVNMSLRDHWIMNYYDEPGITKGEWYERNCF